MTFRPAKIFDGVPKINPIKRISLAYISVLVILTLLVLGQFLAFHSVQRVNDSSAAEINVAGRQRMLSQRIALLGDALSRSPDQETYETVLENFKQQISLMERSHEALSTGSDELNVEPPRTEALKTLYFDRELGIDQPVRVFVDKARALAQVDFSLSEKAGHALAFQASGLFDISQKLLPKLDAVVRQHQIDTEEVIQRLKFLSLFFVVLTLGLLLFSGVWIFRPIVLRLKAHVREISEYAERIRETTRDLRRMSMVASQTINGVIITDKAGVVEWVNEGFIKISGYTLPELIGRKPGDILQGPDTDRNEVRAIREALLREEPFLAEIVNYDKSGRPYWVEIVCNPLRNESGETEGFIAIETDVSERRQLQINKDEFISSVSHELRTPLTAINGSLSLLQSGHLGEFPDKVKGLIDIAKRNSERLITLVNDILDIQRILAGRLNLDLTEIAVKALLVEALESNMPIALQNGISLVCEEIDEGLRVMGDDHRLIQVLTNLISNAVKFSPEGSTVSLSAESSGDFVRIAVTDEGPGISEEFRSQIFGRFAQADSSDTKEKGGTGLGLNICRGIVEEHGGSIRFDCPPKGGTQFSFDIPAARVNGNEIA